MPGSNPLFGLNALGGAIAVRTKDGFAHDGTRAELTAGSFGRVGVQAETGGSFSDELGYFVTASHLEEDGWRDFSPTEAQQIFAKLTSLGERSRVDVSLTRVDTDLVGNGAAPEDLLELDREAIFTRPDHTENTLTMLGVSGEQTVSPNVTLRGNLYVRASDIDTLNGDDSDFEECEATPGFICEEEGDGEEIVLDENGLPIPADDELDRRGGQSHDTEQDGSGFALQADFTGDLGGRENRFTIGVAHDEADVEFGASTELGALDETRQAVAGGVFVGEAFTGLETSTTSTGFYLSNTFTLGERTALTVSGRYNRTHVVLEDLLDDDLDGDHTFQRFNPAVGLTVGTRRVDVLRELQRSEPRALARRADLRRRGRSVPLAERVRRRPAARAGRREDVRSRRARRLGRRPLARRRLPHDERRRHPVHQRRRADERRLLRQRRRDAPRRLRSQPRRLGRRAAHVVARLHLSRRDVPRGASPS